MSEPRRKPKKSPQTKKAESLRKDRRNSYGENSKSSRKNIPRRKRAVNQANRAAVRSALQPVSDEEALDATQEAVSARRPKRWRKVPDVSLAVFLKSRKRRRAES